MRKSNKFIKDVSLSRFLFEQDEDLFGDEEGGGDEAAEEETEEGAEGEQGTAPFGRRGPIGAAETRRE